MTDRLTRRSFFKAAGSGGVVVAFPGAILGQSAAQVQEPGGAREPSVITQEPSFQEQPRRPVRFFFNDLEAEIVTAAVNRLIPADEEWPGAAEAGVVDYIDSQLAGAYGHGAGIYLQGPWQAGTPEQGYQLPHTPAELYRSGLQELEDYCQAQYEQSFAALSSQAQDEVLSGIESGNIAFETVASPVFFETLLANTIEGYLCDPAYGGNRDMVGWRMIGFPGAFANYEPYVDQHGMDFDQPPMSIAQSLVTHSHGDGDGQG